MSLRQSQIRTSETGVFNVKTGPFNAKGDGTTDDTTAIQAAIDAAEVAGGTVFFPAGRYMTSATLSVQASSVVLAGVSPGSGASGIGAQIVCGLAVTPAVQFGSAGVMVWGNSIRDLEVTRDTTAGSPGAATIGVLWANFNNASQHNLMANRHGISVKLTNMDGGLSLGFESTTFHSHSNITAHLNIGDATDTAWFGGQFGYNGGDAFGPATYGILFTGLAEQARFYNLTSISNYTALAGGSALGFEGVTSANQGYDFIHCNMERWTAGVTTDAATTSLIDLHFTGGRYAIGASLPFLDLNAATRLIGFSMVNAAITGSVSMVNPYSTRLIGNSIASDGSTFDGTGAGSDSSLVYSGNFVYETTTFTGPWAGLSVTNNTWGAGSLVTTGLTTESGNTNVSLLGNMARAALVDHEISGSDSGTREVYTTAAGSAFYPTLALGRLANFMPLVLKGGTVADDVALGLAIRNADGKAVLGAYVQLDTSAVTAGAEVADLAFFTKPAGSAATEKFRIGSTGQLGALLSGVPVYANNAAALAGGLTAGMFYRTNGDPDPLCIVH